MFLSDCCLESYIIKSILPSTNRWKWEVMNLEFDFEKAVTEVSKEVNSKIKEQLLNSYETFKKAEKDKNEQSILMTSILSTAVNASLNATVSLLKKYDEHLKNNK